MVMPSCGPTVKLICCAWFASFSSCLKYFPVYKVFTWFKKITSFQSLTFILAPFSLLSLAIWVDFKVSVFS